MSAAVVFAVLLSVSGSVTSRNGGAHSDDPPTRHWYGWQTLAADTGSLSLLFVGTGSESSPVIGLSLVGYLVAPSFVHAAQENYVGIPISLGLRAGAPIAGYFAGGAIACADGCSGGGDVISEGMVGGLIGALIGVLGAVVVDATVNAWTVEEEQ